VLAASTFAQPVAPVAALSDRLPVIADAFDEYRVVALKYRPRIDVSTGTSALSMAFYPGVTTTLPGSILQLGENPYFSMRQTTDDVVVPFVNVPRKVLAGEQSWYKSLKATLTADDSIPGQLIFWGTGTDTLMYEIDGVFEFRGEADPTMTPLYRLLQIKEFVETNLPAAYEREHRGKLAERQKLLELLHYSEQESLTFQWPITKQQNPTERSHGGIASAAIGTGSASKGRV